MLIMDINKIYSVITGDIVKSTLFDPKQRNEVLSLLKEVLKLSEKFETEKNELEKNKLKLE